MNRISCGKSLSLAAAPAADTPTPRDWCGRLLIAAIVSIAAYSVANAGESSPAIPDVYAVKSPEPDRRGTAQQPLVVQPDPDHATYEAETALSTIGLTIYTGVLALANIWLIVEGRRVAMRGRRHKGKHRGGQALGKRDTKHGRRYKGQRDSDANDVPQANAGIHDS
jgi:hypothetical protein